MRQIFHEKSSPPEVTPITGRHFLQADPEDPISTAEAARNYTRMYFAVWKMLLQDNPAYAHLEKR